MAHALITLRRNMILIEKTHNITVNGIPATIATHPDSATTIVGNTSNSNIRIGSQRQLVAIAAAKLHHRPNTAVQNKGVEKTCFAYSHVSIRPRTTIAAALVVFFPVALRIPRN